MISIASCSPRKSDPLTVSNACDSHESSGFSAALMPPAAALECERTGWTLLMMATVAPASAAASAARWPARPAPMIRTSCAGMAASLVRDNDAAASGRMRCIRAYSVAVMAPVRVLLIDDHADVRYLIRTLVGDAPN